MDPQPDHLLVEFVKVSSYGSGTTSKGAVLNEDFDLNKVKGKHVLVVSLQHEDLTPVTDQSGACSKPGAAARGLQRDASAHSLARRRARCLAA